MIKLKPDFGTIIFNQIQSSPFSCQFFGVGPIEMVAYVDRISFTFMPALIALDDIEEGKILPLIKVSSCVTIEAFTNSPPRKSVANRWAGEVLEAGEKIFLQADKDLEYTTPRTKEIVIPLRLIKESAEYFQAPQTQEDLERLEQARLKRLRKATKIVSV